MIILLVVLLAIPVLFFSVGVFISAPSYKGPVSDHFDGKKFINPGGVQANGLGAVLRWMVNRKRGEWTEDKRPAYGQRPVQWEKDNIRVTFVNHSTFLIQVDGINILTDPVWGQRVSPFSWIGPQRMRLPGLKMEELPRIHAVLLSHNHYDHLDITTLRTLFGAHHPQIITPLGVKEYLDSESVAGATDLDWWQEKKINDTVSVQSVPAQHFSGRGALDRDATLWCGYVIRTSKGNIYFAGDTGYNENTFKEIGERTDSIRVSLIPIGAYKPEWFMSPIHVSPEQAVRVHLDVKSRATIGMHFGTFPLADEGYADPPRDLKAALAKFNVKEEAFTVLKEGEVKIFE